jgi:hypothetical protein
MAAIESELGPSEAQPFYAGLKDNEVILRDGALRKPTIQKCHQVSGKLCCTVADIAHLLQGHQFRRSTLGSVLSELRNRKFDEKLAHASCAVRAEEMVADDLGLGDADSSLSSGSASSSNAARRRCVKAAQSQVALENPLLTVDFPVGDRVVPMLVECSVLKTKAVSFEATQRNFTALHQWCMQDVPEREARILQPQRAHQPALKRKYSRLSSGLKPREYWKTRGLGAAAHYNSGAPAFDVKFVSEGNTKARKERDERHTHASAQHNDSQDGDQSAEANSSLEFDDI